MSISRNATRAHLALACAATFGLAACDEVAGDPAKQIGANPVLPAPQQYLLPPMHIAEKQPWDDKTPTVPAGLQIKALASDLKNPRSLYALPNGDILVVETRGPKPPVNRPKDLVMKIVMSFADSGTKGTNQITLLRDIGPDGIAKTRTTFLENLNSPFGIALVGHDLYVADTDALLRFPYTSGETKITAPATKVADLPAGPIDHHWTKSLTASADGTKLYVGVGSNSNITENGMGAELDRAAIGRSNAPPVCIASSRAACAIRPALAGSLNRASSGRSPTSATSSAPTSCRTISPPCRTAASTAGPTAITASTSIRA